MCEINKHNFEEKFAEIAEDIRIADFVAFDMEYTGIELAHQSKYSLFDSAEERYVKLKECLQETTIVQLGLAIFRREHTGLLNSVFKSKVYSFLLIPPTFEPLKCSFLCCASSLEFLRNHGLDFNKVIDDGLNFLNEPQLKQLTSMLTIYGVTDNADVLKENQEDAIVQQIQSVYDWLGDDKNESAGLELEPIAGLHSYEHQLILRKRVDEIWTELLPHGNIRVLKVDSNSRCVREVNENEMSKKSDKYKFYVELMGFTRLFRVLVNLKKPMVGHNCLLDLIAMYEKFYAPLPPTFEDFKYEFNRLFPVVYDTKFIFYQSRGIFPTILLTGPSGLAFLFKKLKDCNNESYVNALNCVVDQSGDEGMTERAHEAGYDAYMSGCVLLLMAHYIYLKEVGLLGPAESAEKIPGAGPTRSPSFRAYTLYLSSLENNLNLIRARQDAVYIGSGVDPRAGKKGGRPAFLVVYKRRRPLLPAPSGDADAMEEEEFELTQQSLADLLAEYGQADVRHFTVAGQERFLVAMSTGNAARAVLRELRTHRWIRVRPYSSLVDSNNVKKSLLAAAVLSTVLSTASLASLFL